MLQKNQISLKTEENNVLIRELNSLRIEKKQLQTKIDKLENRLALQSKRQLSLSQGFKINHQEKPGVLKSGQGRY